MEIDGQVSQSEKFGRFNWDFSSSSASTRFTEIKSQWLSCHLQDSMLLLLLHGVASTVFFYPNLPRFRTITCLLVFTSLLGIPKKYTDNPKKHRRLQQQKKKKGERFGCINRAASGWRVGVRKEAFEKRRPTSKGDFRKMGI